MKNIEKYRDELLERINVCNWYDYFNSDDDCVQDCKACEERFVKWLFEDSEEPVLDDVEREFLSATIKPFRKKIAYIVKDQDFDDGKQCIRIILQNGDGMRFPYFDDDTMYKGMKENKKYSLEELDL